MKHYQTYGLQNLKDYKLAYEQKRLVIYLLHQIQRVKVSKYLLTQSLCRKEDENACHKQKEESEIHIWKKDTHTHNKDSAEVFYSKTNNRNVHKN